MQVLSAPISLVTLRRLELATQEPVQFLDITADVEEIVRSTGLQDGIVTVFSRHTTASIRIQEDEPLLIQDLKSFLARSAPAADHYQHNDFRVRTVHMHDDESPNGHSHCLQMMLGSSETIPVADADLQLGKWQRVFLVELDGPRPRRDVFVQVLGAGR